jgi:endonuclease-3
MAAKTKAQLLTDVYTQLKRRYKLEPRDPRLSVLEAVIYGICHEGTTREQANQAMSRFKDEFFDWNEVRVSSLDEIQGVLAGLPDPEGRAFRIRRFLRQLFEKTYGFVLDGLGKKPLKDAVKALQEYEAGESDFVVATVIQLALGGHAIPIDDPIRRGLDRLGVAEPGIDSHTLRGSLERTIPKNRGIEFVDLMEELTHDTCVAGDPDCPRCELKKMCPTGHAQLAAVKAAAASKASKTRAAEQAKAKAKAKLKAKPAKASTARDGKATQKKAHPVAKSKAPAATRSAKARPAKGKTRPSK